MAMVGCHARLPAFRKEELWFSKIDFTPPEQGSGCNYHPPMQKSISMVVPLALEEPATSEFITNPRMCFQPISCCLSMASLGSLSYGLGSPERCYSPTIAARVTVPSLAGSLQQSQQHSWLEALPCARTFCCEGNSLCVSSHQWLLQSMFPTYR